MADVESQVRPQTEITTAAGRRSWFAPGLILFLFACMAAGQALLLPLFEGADEPDNLLFVRFLAEEGRLTEPVLEPSYELEQLGRGHMPPLWFLTLVPVFKATGCSNWQATPTLNPNFYRRNTAQVDSADDVESILSEAGSRLNFRHGRDEAAGGAAPKLAFFAMRMTTVVWALLALWSAWRSALVLTGGSRQHSIWLLGLAASVPQFMHLSGSITMDPMLAAWGGLCAWAALEWCAGDGEPGGWAFLAGATAGLAALTKLNGLVLVPACVGAGIIAYRAGRSFQRPALFCAAGFALFAGPYYLWGWFESGHPLWSWHYQQISPFHNPSESVPSVWDMHGISIFTLSMFLTWLGDFGWTAVWFPLSVLIPVFLLTCAGGAGLLTIWFCGRRENAADSSARSKLSGAFRWCPSIVLLALGLALALNWGELASSQWGRAGWSRWATLACFGLLSAWIGWKLLSKAEAQAPSAPGSARAHAATFRPAALAFLGQAAVLIMAAEVYFNLHFAQPQARHLYPFYTVLVLALGAGLLHWNLLRVTVVGQVLLCCTSFGLVTTHMRPAGWNQNPIWSATDLGRKARPERSKDEVCEVAWIDEEALRVVSGYEAPAFRWQVEPEAGYDFLLSTGGPGMHHRPWLENGWVWRSLRDFGLEPRGELELPPSFWAEVEVGMSLFVQVLRLGPDGRANGSSSLLQLRRGPH